MNGNGTKKKQFSNSVIILYILYSTIIPYKEIYITLGMEIIMVHNSNSKQSNLKKKNH